MRYPNDIELLNQEINQNELEYVAAKLLETEIIDTITEGGYAPVIRRIRLLGYQQVLAERIRRKKAMRAWTKD